MEKSSINDKWVIFHGYVSHNQMVICDSSPYFRYSLDEKRNPSWLVSQTTPQDTGAKDQRTRLGGVVL